MGTKLCRGGDKQLWGNEDEERSQIAHGGNNDQVEIHHQSWLLNTQPHNWKQLAGVWGVNAELTHSKLVPDMKVPRATQRENNSLPPQDHGSMCGTAATTHFYFFILQKHFYTWAQQPAQTATSFQQKDSRFLFNQIIYHTTSYMSSAYRIQPCFAHRSKKKHQEYLAYSHMQIKYINK